MKLLRFISFLLVIFMLAGCGQRDSAAGKGSEGDRTSQTESKDASADDNTIAGSESGEEDSSSDSQPDGKFGRLFKKLSNIDNCRLVISQVENQGEPQREYFWFKGNKVKECYRLDGGVVTYQDNDKQEEYTFGYPDSPNSYELAEAGAYPVYSLTNLFQGLENILPLLKESGKETVNGFDCIIGKCKADEYTDVTIWFSTEYGLPVKTETDIMSGNKIVVTTIDEFEVGSVTDEDVSLPDGAVDMAIAQKEEEKKAEKELQGEREAIKATEELWDMLNNPVDADNYYAEVKTDMSEGKVWHLGNRSRIISDYYNGYFDYDKQESYTFSNGKFVKDADFSMSYFDLSLSQLSLNILQGWNSTYSEKGEATIAGIPCGIYEFNDQGSEIYRLYVDKSHHIIMKAEREADGNPNVKMEVKVFTPGSVTESDFTK